MGATRVRLTVNGRSLEVLFADPARTLLDWLREDLGLTAAKRGCAEGHCGSCTVLVNGKPELACRKPLAGLDGARVLTLEGLRRIRDAAPAAAGLHPRRGHPVRLLHARDDPGRQGAAGPGAGPQRPADRPRPVAQPLPLHRLREDRKSGAPGRGVAARRENSASRAGR